MQAKTLKNKQEGMIETRAHGGAGRPVADLPREGSAAALGDVTAEIGEKFERANKKRSGERIMKNPKQSR